MDDDDDNSLIEVSKVDLKLKEKPFRIQYGIGGSKGGRAKSRTDSYFNSNNYNSIVAMNRTY